MKVINLEQTFCKEYLQKFCKENYCKLLSNSEAQENNHKQILEWLQNMITKGNWCFEENNLGFHRSILLLVDFCTEESEMNTFIVHGGAIFEYHRNYNCGVVRFLSLLPQDKDIHGDDQARCRLLMHEVMSVFNKHANGANIEVFSIVRKSNFDTPCSNGNILRRQRHLYNAGFRLVNVHHFGNSVQHFLSIYQPELLVPNYQVEDGITTGWVSAESIKKVCEIFGFPFCAEPQEVSVEVSSEFPWRDHLDPAPQSEIAVIGAGIAGLAAAASLCQAGFRVVLLEAANYIGGRVKQQQPFDGFPPIDLGGEFVHGSDSVITKLIRDNNWAFTPASIVGSDERIFLNGHLRHFEDDDPVLHAARKAWDDIIYFGRKQYNVENKRIGSAMEKLVKVINGENRNSTDGHLQPPPLSCSKQTGFCETNIKQIIQDRWQLEKCSHSEDDSVYDWLVEQGYSSQVIDIIDAHEGQSWATSLKMLGVFESSREEDNWNYGSENFRLEGSYSLLVKHYLDICEMVEKRVNWQVREVIWKGRPNEDNSEQKYLESICIKNQNGETLEAKYAIITVPLTVLQDGDIHFVPCLPVEKQIAISSIHMGGALKIVCRFTKQFWPSSVRGLCAASGFVSQLWFYSRDPESRDEEPLHGEKCHLATGFATDEWADRIRHMDETQLCMRFLQQLDEIFRTRDSPKPASDSFMHHVFYDWKKNPFVRGGYSSPTVHACGMREKLAKSVDDRMFFAGEATNINVASTIQSAIETGVRAAKEVLSSVEKDGKQK